MVGSINEIDKLALYTKSQFLKTESSLLYRACCIVGNLDDKDLMTIKERLDRCAWAVSMLQAALDGKDPKAKV
mgnify:CR=1 FL=1